MCLGETMALVAPDPPRPLALADRLVLSSAGAESNVAAGLARLGTSAHWCSRVGDDPLGAPHRRRPRGGRRRHRVRPVLDLGTHRPDVQGPGGRPHPGPVLPRPVGRLARWTRATPTARSAADPPCCISVASLRRCPNPVRRAVERALDQARASRHPAELRRQPASRRSGPISTAPLPSCAGSPSAATSSSSGWTRRRRCGQPPPPRTCATLIDAPDVLVVKDGAALRHQLRRRR